MKFPSLFITALLCTSCFHTKEPILDQQTWIYDRPASFGLNEEALRALDTDIVDDNYGDIRGLVMVREDKMIFENYYNGSNRAEVFNVGRASYTVMALALDYFLSDFLIASLDAPVYTYLPEYAALFEADERKKQLTFRHLVEAKTGFTWNESFAPNGSDLEEIRQFQDWTRYVLAKPLEAAPGLRTTTNTGAAMILARVYQNLLGDVPLEHFLDERFFAPLDIQDYTWDYAPDGLLNGMHGLSLNLLDLTKVGYLMTLEGRWINRERIMTRDWVLESTSAQNQSGTCTFVHGYGWQLFDACYAAAVNLPDAQTFFVTGEKGQHLYVLPQLKWVIAIRAENPYLGRQNPSLSIFVRTLASARTPTVN